MLDLALENGDLRAVLRLLGLISSDSVFQVLSIGLQTLIITLKIILVGVNLCNLIVEVHIISIQKIYFGLSLSNGVSLKQDSSIKGVFVLLGGKELSLQVGNQRISIGKRLVVCLLLRCGAAESSAELVDRLKVSRDVEVVRSEVDVSRVVVVICYL